MVDNLSFSSFDKFRTKVGEVRFFNEQIKEINGEQIESLDKEAKKVFLIPFPEELEHEAGVRRMGCENGSSCFMKNLKLSGFKKLESVEVLSMFDYLGWDTHTHDKEGFRKKFGGVLKGNFIGEKSLKVVIGGGNHIAEFYLGQLGDLKDYQLLKISPKIGNTDLQNSKGVNNFNFINDLCSKTENLSITHYSVLPYLTTRDDYDKAVGLGQKVEFFEESQEPNFEQEIQEYIQKGKRVVVLLDCEALSAEFFHGISQPNIDGLNFKGLLNLAKAISGLHMKIDALLISNFNPTIEKGRSVSFLNTFIYKILEGIGKN